MILNTIVLWAHIFGAIGWMGAGMIFAIVIGPSVAKMSPQARTEFFAKVVPKYLSYVRAFAGITLLFGVAMVAVLADGDYSIFSPNTTFGLLITAGAVLALITFALAIAVVIPTAKKMSVISQAMLEKTGSPPAELPVLGKRLKMASTVALILLVVVTIAMVGAATY